MIDIKRIVSSERGVIIMSCLLGFGIATMFRKVCIDRNCIKFTAPEPVILQNTIMKYNGKCYNNKSEHIRCKSDVPIVQFNYKTN
jgi:hypothetical protein